LLKTRLEEFRDELKKAREKSNIFSR
jgi:hypothetical protein